MDDRYLVFWHLYFQTTSAANKEIYRIKVIGCNQTLLYVLHWKNTPFVLQQWQTHCNNHTLIR